MITQNFVERLTVDLSGRSYDILIGEGLIASTGDLLQPVLPQPRVVIISDEQVAPLYLNSLQASLEDAGIRQDAIILPSGEATKNISYLGELTDRILDLQIDRQTTLVALGGGVIGDITGFAAAILLRGLPFVQIPTTMLAQVDSSVGGKTAINTRHGKNLIGAFYQPRLVIADIDTLDTLSEREFLAGYAETVTYGFLGDASFFYWLEENGAAVCAGDKTARRHAVRRSCEMKAEFVAADELENDRRALLNLGHTYGHALEAESSFDGQLLHGEAVAIGMAMAFDLSVTLGLCPAEDALRARRHLASHNLPTQPRNMATSEQTPETLMAHMYHDKKTVSGRLTLILLRGLGEAFIAHDIDEGAILNSWRHALSS
jgi:3-dehydroquinate synthase